MDKSTHRYINIQNKITTMAEILNSDELEVLNDAMRLGNVRPSGRQRQAARRMCKKNLMVELTGYRFTATVHGKELFKNTKVKRK